MKESYIIVNENKSFFWTPSSKKKGLNSAISMLYEKWIMMFYHIFLIIVQENTVFSSDEPVCMHECINKCWQSYLAQVSQELHVHSYMPSKYIAVNSSVKCVSFLPVFVQDKKNEIFC